MPDIVLSTLNAKYIHAAVGLRYLLANLGELRPRACLAEFDIAQRPLDIVERLLGFEPRIIGFGVYIWNVAQTLEVTAALKRLRPGLVVILGGPEVSYEVEDQEIVRQADYVITGEADRKFGEVCAALLAGRPPGQKVVPAELPELTDLVLPYDLYDADDVAHRIIYVEASRGCPFSCEFCLSSLDIPVRQFPLPALLASLERLLGRGVRHFKFVDRTFNLNPNVSQELLEFFLARQRPDLFLHFEMVPDRLPSALREVIVKFPPGSLQFEVGIQTFNPEVAARINRRQDYARLADNLRFLRGQTGVHLHADLIVGLPGESLESLAAGFDQLVALQPQEIQVGILKRLRGTPIVRHDDAWQMVYAPAPPYELLENRSLDFPTMQRLRRFARYWDLVANSGNFIETTPLLWTLPTETGAPSGAARAAGPFAAFLAFSDWLYCQAGRQHAIALHRLSQYLWVFLTRELGHPSAAVAQSLERDNRRAGRTEQPAFLRPFLAPPARPVPATTPRATLGLKRQARHKVARVGGVLPA